MGPESASCSVVICTYTLDRWSDLVASVESVRRQTVLPTELIVVVDHNPELLARAQQAFPDCRTLASTQPPGLSGARNTGLARATGEIIAFIDDDAIADASWLEELLSPPWEDNVLGVGGFLAPLWDGERPDWLPEEFYWVIGCSYLGMREGPGVRNLIGANMSFRREVLLMSGGFNSRLGRTSTQALAGEETEVCIRARRLNPGGVLVYTGRARVDHRVPVGRVTREYFRARCYGEGLSKARLARTIGSQEGLASERRYTLVTLPAGVLRNLGAFIKGDRAGLARAAAMLSGFGFTAAGYVVGRLTSLIRAESTSRLAPTCRLDEAFCTKPRVLMVTPRFAPFVGGVELHVEKVARLLGPYVNVTVLTTDTTGELPQSELMEGVKVVRVPAWPRKRDYYFAPRIRRIVEAGDWDLVHVQSYHSAVAPLTMMASLRARVPYVVTFHRGGHSSRLRNSLRGLQERMLRPLLTRASKLIAVAEFEVDHFSAVLGLPRDRFVVIPNGSDLAAQPVEAERRRAGRPKIVSVGRLERYKGHERVIEAMPAVLTAYPDARLDIIGSGPYLARLEELVERLGLSGVVIIRTIPAADRRAMAQELTWSSLFVLMSEFETHPIAVVEALELGRPVIVADTSGLRELAERGLARAVPLHASSAELARSIIEELRATSSRAEVESSTWQECADRVMDVYAEVLSTRQGAPESVSARTAPEE